MPAAASPAASATASPTTRAHDDDERLAESFIIATKRLDGTPAELAFAYPPPKGHDATEFCENITMFMFPHGYVRRWDGRALPPPPVHNLFTLTDAHGEHLYGASLSFFETSTTSSGGWAKSLAVLSRRPIYTVLLRYLEQLFLLGLHQHRANSAIPRLAETDPTELEAQHWDALERTLCNLLHEVPAPHRGLAVQVQVAGLELIVERPPLGDFAFDMDPELMLYALMTLDPRVLMQLYHHVLLEHRVLIVGHDAVLVTAIVETLKSLVFPLTWLHVVIPSLPDALDLSTLLDAPVPFLAGAHAAQLAHVEIPPCVVKYDATDGKLVVVAALGEDSAVLPPLPEAATRIFAKLATIRLPDLHVQRKELQTRLWERRMQLQKCGLLSSTVGATTTANDTVMAREDDNNQNEPTPPLASATAAAAGIPSIAPRTYFLVKQSTVHRKVLKLFLELTGSYLQDYVVGINPHSRRFETERFLDRKAGGTSSSSGGGSSSSSSGNHHQRRFFQALAQTAQFQAWVAQHHDYVRNSLGLEEASKFHFVHRALLQSAPSASSMSPPGSSDAPLITLGLGPGASAPAKTFVAHAPQVTHARRTPIAHARLSVSTARASSISAEGGDVVFPMPRLEAFGTPRAIRFPARASDAVHASLGNVLPAQTSTTTASRRRVSKDGSDWMQSFLRTVPLPSAVRRGELLGGTSTSNQEPTAPFKRSRTIDRLKSATPFYRSMTHKALHLASTPSASTTSSSSSSSPSFSVSSTAPATRPPTVVKSIWLLTAGSCPRCRDAVVELTQRLSDVLALDPDKTAHGATEGYCALIGALGDCGHASEAKAVFEECLSGSALVSLAGIASVPHYWRPFSALVRAYVRNGLVQRAFDLLVQVELDEEQLLDPSLGAVAFAADVLGAAKETLVERVFVTFSSGHLGMCLAPRQSATGAGCELIAFHREDDMEPGNDSDGAVKGVDDDERIARTSGLRPHDVVETINGEMVLHQGFDETITALKQASRPMTVTFLRGLDDLERLREDGPNGDDGTGPRRASSSASASSTTAVVDGSTNHHPHQSGSAASSSSSSKSTPRRDLCDRFGLLPRRGIRVTTLADCQCCGTRLSLTDVQRGWSADANDYRTRCGQCGHRFVPRLCIMLGVMTALYRPTTTPETTSNSTRTATPSTPWAAARLPQGATVEHLEYLSLPVIRKELRNLAQTLPLTELSMRELRERKPRIYWNIVVKLLSLAVPIDFLDLPDMTTTTEKPPGGTRATEEKREEGSERSERRRGEEEGEKPEGEEEEGGEEEEEIVRRLRELVRRRHARARKRGPELGIEEITRAVLRGLEQALVGGQQRAVSQPSAHAATRKSSVENKEALRSVDRRRSSSNQQQRSQAPRSDAKRRASPVEEEEVEDEDDERRHSGDERETDVEDMRSSRTLSVTDSITLDESPHLQPASMAAVCKRPSKFMPSLPSAPFRRASRTIPSAHGK